MLQRQTIGEVLERRRATHGDSPQFQKAAEFFQMAMARQEICWDDLVLEFRRNYKDALHEIVAVLLETDDPLIIFHMLRVLDSKDPQEAEAVQNIVRDLDPEKHEVSMLGLIGEPSLRAALKKKKNLPESVRAALEPSAAPAEKPAAKRAKSPRARKKKTEGTEGEAE